MQMPKPVPKRPPIRYFQEIGGTDVVARMNYRPSLQIHAIGPDKETARERLIDFYKKHTKSGQSE